MNIEIVGFYPSKKKKKENLIQGTLHIYLIDYEIDIRGIISCKNKKKWLFFLPNKFSLDNEENERVIYPIFSFSNIEKQKKLLDFLYKNAPEFIMKEIEKERIRK